MISFALILTIRSLLLSFFEKKRRLVNAAFALFFFTCLLIVFMSAKRGSASVQPLLLACLSLIVVASVFWRLKRGPQHQTLKALVFLGFLVLLSLELALAGYLRITHEAPLLKIEIPGVRKSGSYVVQIRSAENQTVGEYLIKGDLVALRAKIIRTKPFLHFLGLTNLCKVERIFGCYKEAKDEIGLTHSVEELALSQPHPLSAFFEKIWQEIFFEKGESLWVKSALMQASFFPLVDTSGKPFQGNFLLTLTETGLSSLALPDENVIR